MDLLLNNNEKEFSQRLYPVYRAIEITRKNLEKEKSLISFIGAPWTLLVYMLGVKKDKRNLNFSKLNKNFNIASVSSVINSGAVPIFAEIDKDSGNMTAETISNVITSNSSSSDLSKIKSRNVEENNDKTSIADDAGEEVLSPMPGVFYSAQSPDKPPFVSEGDQVKIGQTLCIIESMKIMNEIESEQSGTIKKILVNNSDPVEFNQPLFIIE